MFMPQLTEHHETLKKFVGEWIGDEKLHPAPWDPHGGKATSRVSYRLELDGFFLFCEHAQQREGKTTYRGFGVFGWDSFQNKFTMHWFDTMGCDPGPPAMGSWDGSTFKYQSQHPMGHGRYAFTFVDKDTYTFKMEQSQDGQNWMPFLDGTYKRVK